MRFKEEGTENDVNAGEAWDGDVDQEVVKILSVRPTIKGKRPGTRDQRPVSTTGEEPYTRERGTGGTSQFSQFSIYAPREYERGTEGTNHTNLISVEAGVSSRFGQLAILKLILFDLAVSFGDVVTDILQGVYLICWYNERGKWRLKEDTWHYGLWVLIVCWVPGLVCVMHIITHHRSYQPQSESSLSICTTLDTSSSVWETK